MKYSILFVAFSFALAAGAYAVPNPVEAGSPKTDLDERQDNCFYPSHCSATWSGKCENHCAHRGFSHMSGDDCGLFEKRCCCVTE
ncbi:hypothetical protein DFQ26_005329 [Actinomortierella ambigua]|nr:hypothetical protein DFQ26_005329 [Actinomortierella ambigua]